MNVRVHRWLDCVLGSEKPGDGELPKRASREDAEHRVPRSKP